MRLGDLDDLKVHISELMLVYKGTELDNAILNVIDNAPTVEYPEQITVECDTEEERPQGEWKLHGMIYYCSVCGHECGESGDNFCGNCGADMRGKDNQLRDCENCVHHSDNGCEVWECEFKRRSS